MEEYEVVAYLASDIHRALVDFLAGEVDLPDTEKIDTLALAQSVDDNYIKGLKFRFDLSEGEAKLLALQHTVVNMAEGDVRGMISAMFLMDFYRSRQMPEYPRLAQIDLI